MDEGEDETYLDYETFLDPSFSPTSFANTLVLATNNANDTPLDLTTPLSRVLFDVQEVDTRLDKLTSASALPILHYTKENVQAGERVLQELEVQVAALASSYERLESDIIHRHEAAEETRLAAERLWETVKLGRSVSRCLTLGRQLETQMNDLRGTGIGSSKNEDHRAMVRGANTILSVRQILDASGPGEEVDGLLSINVIRTLRESVIDTGERSIISRAEQIVSQFSMSTLTVSASESASTQTYAQIEDTRSRATSALVTLYLLSPVPRDIAETPQSFEPSLMISALQDYLRRAITSSLAGLTAALSALPKLDRTLLEVSARCQNIVALELLLSSIKPPAHPLLSSVETFEAPEKQTLDPAPTLLTPLLSSLDTSSLPSYFWRSMASQLSSRVQNILKAGGVSARTLRSNKDRVRDAIRTCVNKGSHLPSGTATARGGKARDASSAPGTVTVGNWEREAAVMVGAVINVLGR